MVAYFTELKEDAELKHDMAEPAPPKAPKKTAPKKAAKTSTKQSAEGGAQENCGQGSAARERAAIKAAAAAQSFIEQESCAEKEQRQSQGPRDGGAHARKVECAQRRPRQTAIVQLLDHDPT
jgi:hypothetical protein